MGTTLLTTFAEFEALPDIEGKRELVDGEVVTMPPPDNDRSRVAKRVFIRLLERLGERRVWHDHTGYRLGGGWIEPDVSVSWPDQQRDARYFIGSPMIAVEILSPGEEIDRKLTLYFADGAQEVWVLDTKSNAVTVYSRQADKVIRQVVDQEFQSDAAGSTFSLAEIFG